MTAKLEHVTEFDVRGLCLFFSTFPHKAVIRGTGCHQNI